VARQPRRRRKHRARRSGFVPPTQRRRERALHGVDWHPGTTLEELISQPPRFEAGEIAEAPSGWRRALARLHRHGVIHRDIKPANLHLGDDSRWRVLDLGAALSGSDPKAMRRLHAGTPSYMNPEQWGSDAAEPAPADAGSDVYALGVTLYRWLTPNCRTARSSPTRAGRFRRDPEPPSRLRPDVPIWLDPCGTEGGGAGSAPALRDRRRARAGARTRRIAAVVSGTRDTAGGARSDGAGGKIGLGASLL